MTPLTPEQRGILIHLRMEGRRDPTLDVAADWIESLLDQRDNTNQLVDTLKRAADEMKYRLQQHK